MIRTEDLGDIPNGITLHDLVHRVKAEGWKPKDVLITAVYGGYDDIELEVTRQWDDGTLPPANRPVVLTPEPPMDAPLNEDMLDLPDPADTDPPRGGIGPTAPRRPAAEQARPSLLRRALDRRKR